jgi:hypothetical protein
VPSLYDLAAQLQAFAAGELTREALEAWAAPVLAADPLDVAESDHVPWEDAPDEERLFWRLLYVVETSDAPDDALRALGTRVLACLARTASPADTLELLPLVEDQPRLCTILARHGAGIISRTGLLGVVANSGYPPHVKLWLQHADAEALARLCERMEAGAWNEVARMVERAP